MRIALLTASIAIAIALPPAALALSATDWQHCVPAEAIPPFPGAPPPLLTNDDSTWVSATRMQYLDRNLTVFDGQVELQRADQWLSTPHLTYDRAADRFVAQGEVLFQDPRIRVRAQHMEGEPGQDVTRLDQVQFQVIDLQGNGFAKRAVIKGKLGDLTQATYSACPVDHRQWELRGSKIHIDREAGEGSVRHGTLYLGKVPVFYVPYATFPIDDRRRSGFLYPSLGQSNTNGFDLLIPYYLNLAPNYDATVSLRWLADRGAMYAGEFRYLTERSTGKVSATWLPGDNRLNRDRGFASIKDTTTLSQNWQARTDINTISDDRYFEDFGDSLTAASTRLLASSTGLYGRAKYWDASISAELWNLADPVLSDEFEPYRRLPRARFTWEQPLLGGWLVGGLRAEAVAFDHVTLPSAQRVDLRPYVQLPLEGAWWYVTPQFAYRYTAYNLERGLAPGGDERPTRALPITSIDMGAFFERPLALGGRGLIHTLEPRAYYLRVPRSDQTDLPILDTQELTFGYQQLFRDNQFTGADRQSEANQVTFALTSRLLENRSGRELVTATVAQAYLFSPSRTVLPGQTPQRSDISPLVVEVGVNLDDRWTLSTAQHINTDTGITELSAYRLQYRFLQTGVANLSYRFRHAELDQLDASVLYPVSPAWRIVSRWNYSLRDKTTLETLAGFEWQSCCMAVRLLGRHFIRTREGAASNGILLELELRGLGAFGQKTGSLLERAILGYDR